MPIEPIPVTFQMIDAPRRRARPYRIIVQAVGLMAALGAGFGLFAGSMSPAPTAKFAAAPAAIDSPPSFPEWRPSPAPQAAAAAASSGVDHTPVGAIGDGGAPRAHGFSPVERAPDYAGFKVIAGE